MKILCALDFSNSSVNAVNWAAAFLHDKGEGTLDLIHCVNVRSRSEMFLKIDDYLEERARLDLDLLIKDLSTTYPELNINPLIYIADPKTLIAQLAAKKNYDLVVVGTKGLTALKEVTVGSVSAYLINKLDRPLFVIPDEVKYQRMSNIVLGVDHDFTHLEEETLPLKWLFNGDQFMLHLVHVKRKHDIMDQYDLHPSARLHGFEFDYTSLKPGDSITKSLQDYCESKNADALIMIHTKRNWLRKLFRKSISRLGLFHIELPFLILPAYKKTTA